MEHKKETSSSLAGRELAENKGHAKTFCQANTIKPPCQSCKVISAILLQQRMIFAAYRGVPAFDPGRKLLAAPMEDRCHV